MLHSVLFVSLLTLCSLIGNEIQAQEFVNVGVRNGVQYEGDLWEVDKDSVYLGVPVPGIETISPVPMQEKAIPLPDVYSVTIRQDESNAFGFIARTFAGLLVGAAVGGLAYWSIGEDKEAWPFDATRMLGGLAWISCSIVGLGYGIRWGLSGDYSSRKEAYFPWKAADHAALQALADPSVTTLSAPGQGPQSVWEYATDSLPLLHVELLTGDNFDGYIYDLSSDRIALLSDDADFQSIYGMRRFQEIPFTDIARVSYDPWGSILPWMAGGILGSLLFSGIDSWEQLPVVTGVGAGLGAGVYLLSSTASPEGWEWHPDVGDPEFLRRASYHSR
jgi:hypothetical protein